ncbi:MAG: prepilin-type N-terminal cleavage/methylation domain-containing protein [Planctomycetes bacterium]|nr:prepilin-type N-terminal cleavage/methylation domain-containing protein [Planctomycetota bacterium]
MSFTVPSGRDGMTLVELLAVIVILGLLSVAVIPILDGGELRAARNAAASMTSLVATAQGRSLGHDSPAGLWIEPLSVDAAIDVVLARQPAPYRGDTFDATVALSGPVAGGTMELTFSEKGTSVTTLTAPAETPFATTGDFIEFAGSASRFTLICPDPPASTGFRAALRAEAGQTAANTLWPTPALEGSGTVWHGFSILRRPAPAAAGLTLGSGLAIDLAWSGVGTGRFGRTALAGDGSATADVSDDVLPLGTYTAGQAIAILFDRTGAVGEIGFFNTATTVAAGEAPDHTAELRAPLQAPLLLLVGRIDRCGLGFREPVSEEAPGANWQYPESFWVSIDPKTGLARSARVTLRDADGPVTTARRSQAAIRSAP